MPPQKIRFTTLTKRRFKELIAQIIDGTLIEEWPKERKPETKKEKVFLRQLQAIAIIEKSAEDHQTEILKGNNWTELHILFDGKNYYLEICGIKPHLLYPNQTRS